MSITGPPGAGPVRAGIAVSDSAAGHQLALGIMIALHDRERTGRGPVGEGVAARGDDLVPRLPGRALHDRRARAGDRGQPPPDAAADGHVPRGRRPPQHRRARASGSGAGCATVLDDAGAGGRRALRHAAAALRPTALELDVALDERLRPAARATSGSRGSTPPASRAARSTRSTRCSPIRRCSTSRCWRPSTTPPAGPVDVLRNPITMSRSAPVVPTAAPMPGADPGDVLDAPRDPARRA